MSALRETIALDGRDVASFEVVGTGEPALYFQGGPGFSASLLRDDAELLADRFAVHLIDPPGSGRSTPAADRAQYDHLGHARFYDRVRQALGLERVTIMGISFGSIVALTYAALFPESTTRCVAISARIAGQELEGEEASDEAEQMLARHRDAPWYPAARGTWDTWTERVLAATDPAEVQEMMVEVLPLYAADPDLPRYQRLLESFREDGAFNLEAGKAWESGLWQRIDIRPLLAQIRCPTLALTAELDLICGPAHAYALAAELPDATVVIVPGSGHFIATEAPEAFREAILAFAT